MSNGAWPASSGAQFHAITTRIMIPALVLIVDCYTTLRFLEVLGGTDTKPFIRTAAIVLLLLSFVSCSVAVFGGASLPTP